MAFGQLSIVCTLLIAVLLPTRSNAQRIYAEQFNVWFHGTANVQVNGKWWLVQETFFRRNSGLENPMQLKTGVSVERRMGAWSVSLGYAYWLTYPYGTFRALATQPEHRIWLQANYKHGVFHHPRMKLGHRFRLEERLIERFSRVEGEVRSRGFLPQSRARWQMQLAYRLGTKTEGPGVWQALPFAEAIIRFGDTDAQGLFDQWRGGLLFSYQLAKSLNVRVGYQLQHLVRLNNVSVENNHTAIFAMQVDLPRKTKSSEVRP
jgi:Protein of unknown function (DUF2490)